MTVVEFISGGFLGETYSGATQTVSGSIQPSSSKPNTLLAVYVTGTAGNQSGGGVSSLTGTYDGNPITLVKSSIQPGGANNSVYAYVFYYKSPSSSLKTLSVTYSPNDSGNVSSVVVEYAFFSNVNQTTPIDNSDSVHLYEQNVTIPLTTSGSGEMITGVVKAAGTALASSGSQSDIDVADYNWGYGNYRSICSYLTAPTASTPYSLSWTDSGNSDKAAVAMLLNVIPTLTPSVSDSESEGESVSIREVNYVLSVSDSDTVTDTQSSQFANYLISVSDAETVQDVIGSYPDSVNVRESISVMESLLNLTLSVSDSDSVSDTSSILIPILLMSVSDSDSVADSPNIQEVDVLSVTDSDSVWDNPATYDAGGVTYGSSTVSYGGIPNFTNPNIEEINNISVNDTETETDVVIEIDVPSFISVSDAETENESVSILIESAPPALVSTSDTETEDESVTVELQSYISVNDDESSATESVTLVVPSLGDVTVSDSDSDTDVVTDIEIVEEGINVSDAETEDESVAVIVPSLGAISVSDSESESEAVTMFLPLYAISVNDAEVESESVSVKIPRVGNISVSDSEVEGESVTISLVNEISVSDSESEGESVSVLIPKLINVSDAETEGELVTMVLPMIGTGYLPASASIYFSTPGLIATATIASYKYLSADLLAAQESLNVRPYFTVTVVDDTIQSTQVIIK